MLAFGVAAAAVACGADPATGGDAFADQVPKEFRAWLPVLPPSKMDDAREAGPERREVERLTQLDLLELERAQGAFWQLPLPFSHAESHGQEGRTRLDDHLHRELRTKREDSQVL